MSLARLVITAGDRFRVGNLATVLGFWVAVIAAWAWLSARSIHLYRRIER
jgi:hypothetical protein